MIRSILLAISIIVAIPGAAQGPPSRGYEQSLLQTIQDIQHLNHKQALADSREFIHQYPTSKLGQLLYADLLLAQASILPSIGYGIQSAPQLDDLTFEIRQRLSSQQALAYAGYLPENIISMADNQPYILLLDQSLSRLYVYRNKQGTPVLESDYFLSIGLNGYGKKKRGDQKTPIGIYHVTRYIDDNELPDLYGRGAFPLNYPNTWDIRQHRTGGGIWIHGTPSYTYNRAPWSSNGCMVVSNPDFTSIEKFIDPGRNTPVIVVKEVKWIATELWHKNKKSMLQIMTRWIEDWESNNHDRYTWHYSKTDFAAYGRDYKKWEGHKRWVNRNKKDISIEYRNLGIYRYPGEQDLVLMHYDQQFRSNSLNLETSKELYWKNQSNQWKIIYEGVRKFDKAEDRLVEN